MASRKKRKHPVAGIVVVKKFPTRWKVLGLRDGGEMDLPKGRIDPGETPFECATRETEEESGLNYQSDLTFSWGMEPLKIKHATFFVAETKNDPMILKNPHSGVFEHDSAHWLDWDELKILCYPYLKDVVRWAESVVEEV